MKKIILDIINSLGSGKTKIIQFNVASDAQTFLFKEVESSIKNKFDSYLIFEFKPNSNYGRDIIQPLADIIKLCQDNRTVILIHDLFYFKYPEAIINMFYGKNNIDAIITSNIDITYKLKNKDTQVRGRYSSFFLAPMLYNDEINSSQYHVDALKDYPNKDEAIKIYKYLVLHSGEFLTFRKIYESIQTNRGLNYYVFLIKYMINAGMLYCLTRMEIKTMKSLSSGFVLYPAFISDIDLTDLSYDKKFKLKSMAFLIAKMHSDNYKVYQAISYFAGVVNGKYKSRQEFNAGFLVMYFDRKCLIRIDFTDDDASLQKYQGIKTSIPKIVALLGELELRVDTNGIAYYGLENLYKKGLIGYGGF